MKKILVTAPLRQDADVFREYQKGLDALQIPEGYEVSRFFVVNDCPEVIPEIRDAEYIIADNNEAYEKTHNDHLWTMSLMWRMAELRKRAVEEMARTGKSTIKSDRKTALDQLHNERYAQGFRALFRSLFDSARVWCPEFPEMERVDGVSLPISKERSR